MRWAGTLAFVVSLGIACSGGANTKSRHTGSSGDAGDRSPTGGGQGGRGTAYPNDSGVAVPGRDSGVSSQDLPRFVHYIRADPFRKLAIEIDSVSGLLPRGSVERRLVQMLGDLLEKPGGVRALHDQTLASAGSDHAWSFAALQELANASFDSSLAGDEVAIHVMFIDGHSEDDGPNGRILGLAWSNMHIAMFKQTLESSCASAGLGLVGSLQEQACEEAELGVLTHEIGHVIGLVDNGLEMVAEHRDPDHGAHDDSKDCVMYWAYEGDGITDVISQRLLGGDDPTLSFDPHCRADIDAVK